MRGAYHGGVGTACEYRAGFVFGVQMSRAEPVYDYYGCPYCMDNQYMVIDHKEVCANVGCSSYRVRTARLMVEQRNKELDELRRGRRHKSVTTRESK